MLAFVAQLVLAIGHVELPGPLHQRGVLQQMLSQLLGGIDRSAPDQDKKNKQDGHDDGCPICWLQSVAGSATLPEPAALVVVMLCVMAYWHAPARLCPASIRLAYQVRAPPALVSF